MLIIVEGCGAWAMKYLDALKRHKSHGADLKAIFTFDSSFGLESPTWRMPVKLYSDYLQSTLKRVEQVKQAGFAVIDTRDTLFRLMGKKYEGRANLPEYADAVFVTTPDSTHCDVATFWLRRAARVFVEKPFDVSSARIERFCQELRQQGVTEVYAIDHYLVRCEQIERRKNFFLQNLDGIESFEFSMTEENSAETLNGVAGRVLSIQEGMIFDMGSHALPVLLPFIDLGRPIEILEVYAGICDDLQKLFFRNAESYSEARVRLWLRPQFGGGQAKGALIAGKMVGDKPGKHLLLKDAPEKQVTIQLGGDFEVSSRDTSGSSKALGRLNPDWAYLLVQELFNGALPQTVTGFQPEGALSVVRFLEQWRNLSRARSLTGQPLPIYKAGNEAPVLRCPTFKIY